LTLDGVTYSNAIEYLGDAGVNDPDFLIPTAPFATVVIPATLVGSYTACLFIAPGMSHARLRPAG
jgi:hypothetical protein